MLILSRKKNESIMIGDDVEIMITDVSGEVVKLGISAPRRVSVHRKEVYEAIKAENLSASKASTAQLSSLSQFLRSRQSGQKCWMCEWLTSYWTWCFPVSLIVSPCPFLFALPSLYTSRLILCHPIISVVNYTQFMCDETWFSLSRMWSQRNS